MRGIALLVRISLCSFGYASDIVRKKAPAPIIWPKHVNVHINMQVAHNRLCCTSYWATGPPLASIVMEAFLFSPVSSILVLTPRALFLIQ